MFYNDYVIFSDPNNFSGSDYFTIGPGRYNENSNRSNYFYICEDDLEIPVIVISKYFPNFDPWGINNIPKVLFVPILADLRLICDLLYKEKYYEVFVLIGYKNKHLESAMTQLEHEKEILLPFLKSFIKRIEVLLQIDRWIFFEGP